MAKETRTQARQRRHLRVRRKVAGTAARPRLNVYRSLNHIYVQVIDDEPQLREQLAGVKPLDRAKEVGKVVAQRAREKGIEQVVFDRGGYPYHGRIKALADGSREGGLVF
jgi:large subunit ribosomal protein L18